MISFTGKVVDVKRKLFQLDEDKVYDVEIKIHREKRSLNANSYCWKLCSEIASAINSDKDSVYLLMLKRYGISDLVPISNQVPIDDYIKYYDIESKTDKYTWYKIYKGSSKYDTKEMSVLLNGIVSECKEMGIPTKEDLEIEKMLEEWEREWIKWLLNMKT